jgi:hypothetical protein
MVAASSSPVNSAKLSFGQALLDQALLQSKQGEVASADVGVKFVSA